MVGVKVRGVEVGVGVGVDVRVGEAEGVVKKGRVSVAVKGGESVAEDSKIGAVVDPRGAAGVKGAVGAECEAVAAADLVAVAVVAGGGMMILGNMCCTTGRSIQRTGGVSPSSVPSGTRGIEIGGVWLSDGGGSSVVVVTCGVVVVVWG